jgi:hypothetical protein
MRETLEQLLGPSCAQYIADIHATDRQSHLIHYIWTHESGPLTPAEADAVCLHAFSCLPKAVELTAPAAPGQPAAYSLPLGNRRRTVAWPREAVPGPVPLATCLNSVEHGVTESHRPVFQW